MKTQKKKTFNLNKLRIAELKQTDSIKGGSDVPASAPGNACSDGCIIMNGCK